MIFFRQRIAVSTKSIIRYILSVYIDSGYDQGCRMVDNLYGISADLGIQVVDGCAGIHFTSVQYRSIHGTVIISGVFYKNATATVRNCIILDLTVYIVQTNDTFLQYIFKCIITDINIFMIRSTKHRVCSDTAGNISESVMCNLYIFHRRTILIDTGIYQITVWHIKLDGFLFLKISCGVCALAMIQKSTVADIETIDGSDLHLMYTTSANQCQAIQSDIPGMKEPDHTAGIFGCAFPYSTKYRDIFKGIIAGTAFTGIEMFIAAVWGICSADDHVDLLSTLISKMYICYIKGCVAIYVQGL